MHQHLNYRGPREKRNRKGLRKYLKRLQLKTSLIWERKQSSPGGAESPIQDKSKEKHAKTHINQTIKIKYKEKIVKAGREKQQITYKRIPIRVTADLSAETLQARSKWQDIFKVMKGKNLQPRLLYPARISFRFNREIKTFTDKQKLREFSTTKPALQQMLKEILQARNTREGKHLQ